MNPLVSPEYQAKYDYSQGGTLNGNPYPKGSEEYERYQWQMHRLEAEELKELIRGY